MNNNDFLSNGYTPENFTKILWDRGIKREDVAEFLCDSLRTVHRWAVELERETHADMPLAKWRKFLAWAVQKPVIKELPVVDVSNKLAAYFNADLQSTSLNAVIAEIPVQFKSDLSEYLEQGIEQTKYISAQKWAEILDSELMRFKSVLVVLGHKAPSNEILERLYAAEPESDAVLRSITRNSNASDELRAKCIAQLKDNHKAMTNRDYAGSDYALIWQGLC